MTKRIALSAVLTVLVFLGMGVCSPYGPGEP